MITGTRETPATSVPKMQINDEGRVISYTDEKGIFVVKKWKEESEKWK